MEVRVARYHNIFGRKEAGMTKRRLLRRFVGKSLRHLTETKSKFGAMGSRVVHFFILTNASKVYLG